MNLLTIPIKLKCSEKEHKMILQMLNDKRDCFNAMSEELFKTNWKNKS